MKIEGKGSGGRLYQRVAEQLAAAITAGEYPAGSRLPAERRLAERFDVSRPTVREAIIALELAGVVEVKGGSGVYVTEGGDTSFRPSETDIGPFEILQARILFEGEAAALAARQVTDEEMAQLEEALEDMIRENMEDAIAENADERFHLLIARATHNDAVVSVCEHLWDLRNNSSVSARILEKVRQTGSKPRIEEHQMILDALRKRDPQAARAAMREHLNRVVKQLLDTTEAEAIEEARRQIKRDRERFSMVE